MPAAGETLLIRADADPRMGTGHVMRCLALAEAWHDAGGPATLVAAAITPALESRLNREGVRTTHLEGPAGSAEDAAQTIQLARQAAAGWIVVDGYQFDAAYQASIKDAGCRLLVIDDYGHADRYAADVVLNQNLHAEESLYRNRGAATRLLLGPRYAMLRREFQPWIGWTRTFPEVARRLLVTLGGSDPDNATQKVIEAVAGLDIVGLETVVLVGGSSPWQAELREAARRAGPSVRMEFNATDMPRWMTWADAAVAAAGSTLWELAFLAVPSLTLILAENQEPAARLLAERIIYPTLGWASDVSVEAIGEQVAPLLRDRLLRQQAGQAAAQLVDGRGVSRILEAMKHGQDARGTEEECRS